MLLIDIYTKYIGTLTHTGKHMFSISARVFVSLICNGVCLPICCVAERNANVYR